MVDCTNDTEGRGSKTRLIYLIFLLLSLSITSLSQEKGGREAAPTKPTTRRATTKPTNRPPPKPQMANIVLSVDPADSVLIIDNQPSDKVDALGTAKLIDLKPGAHSIVVRKAGYREKQQSLDLKAGDNDPITIRLEMLKGSLSVAPNVDGAEISLRNVDADRNVGTYAGGITQMEFLPGEYELSVSKKGYKPVTRRFRIKAGESAYLEPSLEPLPKPRPQIAMNTSVRSDGKYYVVEIVGSSGTDSPRSGSISVSVVKNSLFADVSGTFTGLPCDVDLVRVDNITDATFMEVPGPANQWMKTVVRVKPKDSKKPVRFAINWRLRDSSPISQSTNIPHGLWVGRSQTIDRGETRNFPMRVDFDRKTANDGECQIREPYPTSALTKF